MSHFDDLCQLSSAVEEKKKDVERLIRREAVRLVSFYKDWLGLPSEHWVDERGECRPYVDVGFIGNDGTFQAAHISEMPMQTDGTLQMVLRTATGSNIDFPAVTVPVSLQLMSAGDGGIDVAISVNNDKPIPVFVTGTDEYSYSEVALKIKSHIQKAIQKQYPASLK
ncbi:hypothetical protein IBT47_10430 [Erwinia sp. S43]|uniref:hypothetical protein n=1 Tax=Erwinia sp. S43 TaxID=2769339 RepID=UPI001F3ACFD6|nr:hypothetical protein [Erwinia sp. S43]MBK0032699.1 hypothetical protein [Erwinia sp. S43]